MSLCQEYFGDTLKSYFAPLPPGGQTVEGVEGRLPQRGEIC